MAADYRAGAGIDRQLDAADREAGRRLDGPLMVLRGGQYESRPLAPAWEGWCDRVDERLFDCGHFIAEEVPDACAAALASHFRAV
jgi:haloacetate dehalogenase